MDRLHRINPFAKRETHDPQTILWYKIFTILTWLLAVVSSVYYTFHSPSDDITKQRTIWGQNKHHHTAFALNSCIASIYWIVLFVLQGGYVWHLFSPNADHVQAAASVGSHFIFNNLLHFAFVMLFVRSHFVWAELILIINFFNLSSLYFRHPASPRFVHLAAVSGPLAWAFVALYWNGAIAFNAEGLFGRILANVAVWGILVYGLFFLVTFKDYTMGFSLSVLSASLGVGQFLRQVIAFQWIFAFTIMAALFVATFVITFPEIFGGRFTRGEAVVAEDQERAPLLDDN
ncbi:hypothetical protein V493_00744 [Pseudogymnoascus sp. VKM F-4281 (FW-2241)]|nr:hypothetical protein V493_00744 [Pseudogymnoascus sp. VKM F-4281 (FW-2241)]